MARTAEDGGQMVDQVLVTGGAGYVGAHICKALAMARFEPVVYDDFSNGHRKFVKWGASHEGDIRDKEKLVDVLRATKPVAIIHCAAFIEVAESIKDPIRFFDNNVAGAISVLQAALAAGVHNFVFSSSCAVYGAPVYTPLDEAHPLAPVSPYGRTKLMVDQILSDLSAHTPLKYISLRYFNAAGADMSGQIGERHQPESHALPLAIHAALGRRSHFSIFGQDYDTHDGTAVRDYIHVSDLAAAHVAAIKKLLTDRSSGLYNLGAGTGASVQELVDAVQRISGRTFEVRKEARRAGDPPILIADNSKVKKALDWSPKYNFEDTVRSAIAWHSEHEARLFGEPNR